MTYRGQDNQVRCRHPVFRQPERSLHFRAVLSAVSPLPVVWVSSIAQALHVAWRNKPELSALGCMFPRTASVKVVAAPQDSRQFSPPGWFVPAVVAATSPDGFQRCIETADSPVNACQLAQLFTQIVIYIGALHRVPAVTRLTPPPLQSFSPDRSPPSPRAVSAT